MVRSRSKIHKEQNIVNCGSGGGQSNLKCSVSVCMMIS